MASIVNSLRGLADPTRLRILCLLRREDLSVAELQEVLSMGQSRISTQLAQLKRGGLVQDRRSGKRVIYGLVEDSHQGMRLPELLAAVAPELEDTEADEAALALVLARRTDRMRAYFDELAGKFGKTYLPGRSWKGLAESLLKLMPPMIIADLGAGEGTFSQLLAQRAQRVIAIDNSPKMIEYASGIARQNGVTNLEFRLGDLENPPIEAGSVDLAFFSQALHHAVKPDRAVKAAHRILRPGGRIVILDLLCHGFEEARELYLDSWLGFSQAQLQGFLEAAAFQEIEIAVVDREPEPPHFQTVLALASKPASPA
jgi:ubiquinone/menaquinone biosynthesis C-methylase UbiE